MARLEQRFGQKVNVLIKAQKNASFLVYKLETILLIFSKIRTELNWFKEVIKFYKDEGSYSSGDQVNSILSSCFSLRNRECFTDNLKNKGMLDKLKKYLNEVITWVNDSIKNWQSGVGESLIRSSDKKVVSGFSKNGNQTKSNNYP